ncbi:MAG: ABC transporter ATP-binding protein [Thermodesulfobacteriota bacterium]
MLELREVETFYGNIMALKGVSLSVSAGEIVALIGANGAGKSTTLMTVCGIVPPRSGEILFNGTPLQRLEPHRIVALGISQVPEGRRIFPLLSVTENLDMGAFLRTDRAGIAEDRNRVFSLFPILRERRHQQGGTLSGGEQQMLAIARALMARPGLLLLDEPSLGLAPLAARLIFRVIRQINAESRTAILLVEQNANMALHVAHRAYVMENGRVTREGRSEDLLNNEEVRRAYLGV